MKTNDRAKINAKAVAAASKGIAVAVNSEKKALKQDRVTMLSTLRYIQASETAEAATWRAALNLKKSDNRARLKEVAAWIMARTPRVARKIYVASDGDAVNVTYGDIVPVNKNGREITDYITVVADAIKQHKTITAQRNEVARQIWETRRKMIESDSLNYFEHIDNILSYANRAPRKMAQTQLPDIRVNAAD